MLIGKTMRCWRAFGMALVGLVVVAGVTVLGPAGPASAAGPLLRSPANGEVVDHIPVLQWYRINGVPSYDVQVSANSGFSNLLINTSTVSSAYVPPIQLPTGQIYWRVRASNTGDSGWTAGSFDRAPLDVPTITARPAAVRSRNPPARPSSPGPGWQAPSRTRCRPAPTRPSPIRTCCAATPVQATSYVVPDLQLPPPTTCACGPTSPATSRAPGPPDPASTPSAGSPTPYW